jgi:hypothetical protein
MSQLRRTTVRGVVLAVALGGLGAWAIAPAQAGDLGGPVYGPAPYPAPNYGPGPVYDRGGPCRIVLDRRIDPYGREVVHRMRVCDEGPVYPSAEGPPVVAPPEYGYPAPRYYGPQPSGYDPYPLRPPAPIGPRYYN